MQAATVESTGTLQQVIEFATCVRYAALLSAATVVKVQWV
jgi:hypothetical protein